MTQCRIIVEFYDPDDGQLQMRWEHAACEKDGVFRVLGMAFEVAQREASPSFHAALQAFLQGAMIQNADVADVVSRAAGDGTRTN